MSREPFKFSSWNGTLGTGGVAVRDARTLAYDNEEVRTLAEVSHELWRRRLQRAGWRFGPTYDPERRCHDLLVPFADVPGQDREEVMARLRTHHLPDLLADCAEYDRSASRPLRLAEMKVGLRVGWSEGVVPDGDLRGATQGHVTDWEVDPGSGQLRWAEVVWDNGATSRHEPSTRSLRRLDSSPDAASSAPA